MSRQIKAPRGTFDVLPDDVPLWLKLEAASREAFGRYGYSEIRTPLVEETRLFVRGIGEATDIVEKEMYTFPSKGRDDSISLRPEATAGIVRAYIQHNFHKKAPLQKLAYMGPMFRYERPQAGRQRQFHQVGVEVLGTHMPEADVETIALALDVFKGVGLLDVDLKLNTMGCTKCRDHYRAAISEYLAERAGGLCGDCRRRMERNVFRVFDCKVEACRGLLEGVSSIDEYLCGDCATHFDGVVRLLDELDIEYRRDNFLVRGLDYYTRTVYEFAHSALGARDAVGGGGRYDNLVEELGGPPTGAVGFSIGSEATLLAVADRSTGGSSEGEGFQALAALVMVDESVKRVAFRLLGELRCRGISADMPFEIKSMKAQMRAANRRRARAAVIIGPGELDRGRVKVKDMAGGEEIEVEIGRIVDAVSEILARPAL